MAGYPVVAVEREQAALTAGQKRIEGSLDKLLQRNVKKGTMTADAAAAEKNNVLSRVTYSTDLNAVQDCDIVIEAIAENMQLKLDFYTDLAKRVKREAIFASNTSSLPITGMAEASGRGENFVRAISSAVVAFRFTSFECSRNETKMPNTHRSDCTSSTPCRS